MSKPAVHFSRIRRIGDRTITGTLCNRMSGAGDDINCTDVATEVTCKLCVRELAAQQVRRAASNRSNPLMGRDEMTLQAARKIVHAPEAFTKRLVREAVAFIASCQGADEEDRFWAGAAI